MPQSNLLNVRKTKCLKELLVRIYVVFAFIYFYFFLNVFKIKLDTWMPSWVLSVSTSSAEVLEVSCHQDWSQTEERNKQEGKMNNSKTLLFLCKYLITKIYVVIRKYTETCHVSVVLLGTSSTAHYKVSCSCTFL